MISIEPNWKLFLLILLLDWTARAVTNIVAGILKIEVETIKFDKGHIALGIVQLLLALLALLW
jgi:hypothetical protein